MLRRLHAGARSGKRFAKEGTVEHELGWIPYFLQQLDYPHTESTFPRSREVTSAILSDVPDSEKEKILYTNVKRLYGFEV